MHAPRGSDEAKVCAKLPAAGQVDGPAVDVGHHAADLLEQEHSTGVVPDLGEALARLVHPDGVVGVAEREGGPAGHPAEQVRGRTGRAELGDDGGVDRVDARVVVGGVEGGDEGEGVRGNAVGVAREGEGDDRL